MQTEEDAERIKSIGACARNARVTGNLKFDIELQNYSEEEKRNLNL